MPEQCSHLCRLKNLCLFLSLFTCNSLLLQNPTPPWKSFLTSPAPWVQKRRLLSLREMKWVPFMCYAAASVTQGRCASPADFAHIVRHSDKGGCLSSAADVLLVVYQLWRFVVTQWWHVGLFQSIRVTHESSAQEGQTEVSAADLHVCVVMEISTITWSWEKWERSAI